MKTAISLPESVVREAERHAQRVGKTKNQLVAEALTEYFAKHATNGSTKRPAAASPRPPNDNKRRVVKSRFSKAKLQLMARNNPVPKSWFDQPAVDLTKPK